MENPIKTDYFGGTTIFGNIHIDLHLPLGGEASKVISHLRALLDFDKEQSLKLMFWSHFQVIQAVTDLFIPIVNQLLTIPKKGHFESTVRTWHSNFQGFRIEMNTSQN